MIREALLGTDFHQVGLVCFFVRCETVTQGYIWAEVKQALAPSHQKNDPVLKGLALEASVKTPEASSGHI